MKVVLLHDVQGVGKAGDLAKVADGYGRNFLLPRKLAMLADTGVMSNLEKQQQAIQRRAAREHADAESVATRIQGTPISIEANAGVGGKLYGSVTSQDIADKIKELHGLEVDKRRIDLSEPIRTVGTFTVPIRFMRDVVAQVTVNVTVPGGEVAEAAEAAPAAAEAAPEAAEAAPAE